MVNGYECMQMIHDNTIQILLEQELNMTYHFHLKLKSEFTLI